MQFASDNRAGLAPEIIEAITREAAHRGGGYGEDPTTAAVTTALAEVFEHDVTVFPVLTGTAANALALATLAEPWGAVVCEREAHIVVDECGAPEFYGGGLRLVPIDGEHGKLTPAAVRELLATPARGDVHESPLQLLSLTNLTEFGTAYTAAETAELCAMAHDRGLRVHLDGARFANAVAGGAGTPAQLTWQSGVDVVIYGGSKNGAMAAEAVVFFDPTLAGTFERRRKRGGHLASKMRFVSAQLLAGLTDDRWLTWASHANAMTQRLADGVGAVAGIDIVHPVDGNQIWLRTDADRAAAWAAAGAEFYDTTVDGFTTVRLVCDFSTTQNEIDAFLAMISMTAVDTVTSEIP